MFCLAYGVQPSEYLALNEYDRQAFAEAADELNERRRNHG